MTEEARGVGWAGPPDPVPEQRPWLTDDDAMGWRTVYRGTGPREQRRRGQSSVMVEVSPEQGTWLYPAAEAAGLMAHELIGKLIDAARTADANGCRLDPKVQEAQEATIPRTPGDDDK